MRACCEQSPGACDLSLVARCLRYCRSGSRALFGRRTALLYRHSIFCGQRCRRRSSPCARAAVVSSRPRLRRRASTATWPRYSAEKDNVQSLDIPAAETVDGHGKTNDCSLWDTILSFSGEIAKRVVREITTSARTARPRFCRHRQSPTVSRRPAGCLGLEETPSARGRC
jgi:hypothetical protein